MSIPQARAGIAAALVVAGIDNVHDFAFSIPTPPAAIVALDDFEYGVTFTGGPTAWPFVIRLLAGPGTDSRSAALQVDKWLDTSGAESVRVALEADNTLGGRVSSVRVQGARNHGVFDYSGSLLAGVELLVEVIA